MAKYRKKPAVVEAHQVSINDNIMEYPHWLIGAINCDHIIIKEGESVGYIRTLEGNMIVSDGDFIIRGVQGEFYPCKPDIFELTYEVAEE